MSAESFAAFIGASEKDRLDLFLATANRLGTTIGNVDKDFWVCWTLEALYHRLPAGRPRMLFKGGTSLSRRTASSSAFSEDIEVRVFRDDLGQSATIAELEALSGNKPREKLDAAFFSLLLNSAANHFRTTRRPSGRPSAEPCEP